MTTPTHPAPRVGRYVLGAPIGKGGAACVFEAYDTVRREQVAIKILTRVDGPANPEIIARFDREAAATTAVDSDHVVRVLDAGTDPEVGLYLVMERLQGMDLRQYRIRFGRLHAMWAVSLVYQVAQGLAAAHAVGVAHRDLKPSNVFLCMGERGALHAKLVDFGIAKLLDTGDLGGMELTRPGTALGTPQYMAPEQVRAPLTVDHRADVYALGALLYEVLSGEPLVRFKRNYAEMLVDVLEPKAPRIAAQVEGAPAELDQLLGDLLRQDPAERPQSMAQVMDRLAEIAAAWARVSSSEAAEAAALAA